MTKISLNRGNKWSSGIEAGSGMTFHAVTQGRVKA